LKQQLVAAAENVYMTDDSDGHFDTNFVGTRADSLSNAKQQANNDQVNRQNS